MKSGRPAMPPEARRSYWLKFRVTAAEAESLFSAARACRKNLSVWIRERIVSVAQKEQKGKTSPTIGT